MSGTVKLPIEDKEFLRILVESAFSNPFEKQSFELAYKIAGGSYPAGEELSRHVFESVKSIIDKVTENERFNWKHFSGEDKELVSPTLCERIKYSCNSMYLRGSSGELWHYFFCFVSYRRLYCVSRMIFNSQG
jgi:hypothetical protein